MHTYCFKLCPTRKTRYLDAMLVIACDIYNWVLLTKQEAYEKDGLSISLGEMKALVSARRNEPNSAWQMIGSQACQQIVDRIYYGYDIFFANLKRGKRASPPGFKKHSKYRSITYKQEGNSYKLLDNNRIRIGGKKGGKKCQVLKYYDDEREIKGKVKTLTIKKNRVGEWFIYITTDHQEVSPKQIRSGNSVGLDFGLKTFLVGSDGLTIQAPLFFKQDNKKIKRLSKILGNKKKGSGNWERARLDLARAYEDINNKRKDFHWKLALDLVRKYDTIVLETLNIDGMRRLWGPKINDLGFYSFVQILQQQAAKHGTKIVFINRWFPSSKTCSTCGLVKDALDLRDRSWECQGCHTQHDRDLNAAQNIHRVGISTLAGAEVSPSIPARKSGKRRRSALIAQSQSS